MSININGEKFSTFSDYINDENKVSKAEKAQVDFEAELIGKVVEAREKQGLSQRDLAEICGMKQPAIARLESMRSTPQIDTLFKVLGHLGYTLSIVPLNEK
ncbi:MAG: helix-turn-helix transcriptional regulator [Clostridia bacterium]